jgi:hypothetical protein
MSIIGNNNKAYLRENSFTSCNSLFGGVVIVKGFSNLTIEDCNFTECECNKKGGMKHYLFLFKKCLQIHIFFKYFVYICIFLNCLLILFF